MQTVILCGGKGTRIRDAADGLPKPLVPIGNRPILWHIMKAYAHFGYRDFVLCLGHKSWAIKRYFLDYHLADSDFTIELKSAGQFQVHGKREVEDWRITLVETGENAMTGCRVKRIEPYIKGEEFLLTYGDGVSDVDINALVEFHRSHGRIGTVTAVSPPGRFGELEVDGCSVQSFNEKPVVVPGRINGGFFVMNRRVFDRMEDNPSLIFESATLPKLVAERELHAFEHNGFWHPMDSSRDYNCLNEMWQEGNAPWMVWRPRRLRIAA